MVSQPIKFEDLPSPKERYTLEDSLGSGAFGRVFAAKDAEASNKRVAIKIQKLNENIRIYIEQEYRVLRDLTTHPNIPDFYGIYKKDDEIWFVMEICEGGPVLDLVHGLLAQNRRMREEHIAYILNETVKAVIFLQEKCAIHRDVRAGNILLTKDGEVKLVDFGFSAVLNGPLDKTDGFLGSPNWMAPEIITSKRTKRSYDQRVDVWSLGITAIELGDGKAPYHSMHPTRILFQIVANPPPTLYRTSNWSESYVDFINECLVKNPEYRPYAEEVLDHPFLTQIPENDYHLTLEIKSLVNDVNKLDLPKGETEVAVIENFLTCGDGDLEMMLVEDLASLDQISEKNILLLLEERMKVGQFQTFAGDVLIVLNPFDKRDVFGDMYHQKYHLKSRSENAPHIYSIADSAYQHALHHQIPQKIILSGESGSGKTRNYLHLINHLLFLGQNTNVSLDRIRGGIKLIHSLTHASTPINNYSTRCVFKTDIKYGTTGKVSGAIFNVYQLEKWRISSVDMFQGNYHFLYYIYDGLKENKKLEQYHLNPDRQYRYLRVGDCNNTNSPKFNINKNLSKFKKILKIFEDFDMDEEQMDTIFDIVAAILIIGEVRFQESESEVALIENSDNIERISQLLKIDPKKLEWALTNYCSLKKGTVVRRRSTVDEARDARDVFANNLYTRLVDYLVGIINNKLASGRAIFGERYSVQIFDYSGFECVKTNHLPQLFINSFNEQLHYHYLQRLFSWEYLDVKEENLEYQPFGYYDNKKTLDQLLTKSEGLFSIIDDASKSGHDAKYVRDSLQNSASELVTVTGASEFSIAHFTGKVKYCVTEMCDKNRDFLPPEIIETLRLSDNATVKMLFSSKLNKTGNLIISDQNEESSTKRYKFQDNRNGNQYSQIKRMRTCINTFKSLSLELLKELSIGSGSGGTHFVRCIRTNLKNKPQTFDYQLVKHQVRALAVTETAKARQRGYPHRIPFQEFLRRYQFLAFDFDETVEVTKDNCRLLLIRLKMEGWSIGKNKVFLKYYNEEYLAMLYETQVKKIIKIQSILRRFLAKCLMQKKVDDQEKNCISVIGKQKSEPRKMTEEEAAGIIQRAYRESNIRKSYPDFAKDYKVLDEETCEFIRNFANKWRRNSLFHVLVLYRAIKFQDLFNFTQQVHLYNIGIFYQLQGNDVGVSLKSIDSKAQAANWFDETKIPLRKVPFRLNEIPFYDTSIMCNQLVNPGVSVERDETWDQPYRWRQLVSSKFVEESEEDMTRTDETLINVPFARDPEAPVREVPDNIEDSEGSNVAMEEVQDEDSEEPNAEVKIVVEEFVTKEDKEEENTAVRKKTTQNVGTEKQKETKVNCDTKLANKDFDYIKSPIISKPKSVDPIAELRTMGPKNVSEDEPPFNFQGMLRKTNFRKEPVKPKEEEVQIYSLKKTPRKTNDENTRNEEDKNRKNVEYVEEITSKVNGIIEDLEVTAKRVIFELAPGITLEGFEVEL